MFPDLELNRSGANHIFANKLGHFIVNAFVSNIKKHESLAMKIEK